MGLFRFGQAGQFGPGGVQANLQALDFAEPAAEPARHGPALHLPDSLTCREPADAKLAENTAPNRLKLLCPGPGQR